MPSGNATFSGPSSVVEGTTSTAYTITPNPIPITGTYTPNDGGLGGTFTPASLTWAASSAPQTFVYNAPNTIGFTAITPVWSGGGGVNTLPPNLPLHVTGANTTQHLYQFPQFAGVPPFQILKSNDQIPGAAGLLTTYTQVIAPTSGTVPATATLTYTLSAALATNITITPTSTAGSFSPTSVTITAGSLSGTTTFSDPTVGVASISSTNNQGLANPAAITFTANAGAVTYTQGISPTSGTVPATATLTYTLSGTLASNIIITPSATNGSFSPTTVTILAGSLTGTSTFSDSVVGVSTISSTNNQSLSNPANITFTANAGAVTYTQGISPTSGIVPATATLTYTLSGTLASNIIITPSATNGTFSPTTVTINAGSLTGTSTLSDSVVGVSTISSTNNQSLANPGNITFTGLGAFSSTSYGTMEAGGGTIAGLTIGASAVIMGPIQTPVREGLREVFFASANGAFHLNYQYTTDGGTTWYIGDQVASSANTADGTTSTNYAHLKLTTGFQWQVQITSTAGTINVAFEKRLISRGKKSS